jgi:FMN phosphatase YigB (HAD superfamily)
MKNETKKVLLFDVYQTLIDIDVNEENKKENKAKGWDNFAKSIRRYGIHITPTELIELTDKKRASFYIGKDKKIYHHNFCNIMEQVLKEDLSAELPREEICSLIYEYHKIGRGYVRLYPGVAETLARLAKKYILSVASYTQGCFTKHPLNFMSTA